MHTYQRTHTHTHTHTHTYTHTHTHTHTHPQARHLRSELGQQQTQYTQQLDKHSPQQSAPQCHAPAAEQQQVCSGGEKRLPERVHGEGGGEREGRRSSGVVGAAVLQMCACIESRGQEGIGDEVWVEIDLEESFDAHGERLILVGLRILACWCFSPVLMLQAQGRHRAVRPTRGGYGVLNLSFGCFAPLLVSQVRWPTGRLWLHRSATSHETNSSKFVQRPPSRVGLHGSGQSHPHRGMQRLSPDRAQDPPLDIDS